MRKRIALAALAAVALAAFSLESLAGPNLADRHVGRGVACKACHKKDPEPGATVRKQRCLSCHVSYDALKERTAAVRPHNPHDTHLGEEQCTRCHAGHKPSKIACLECHQFVFSRMP